MTLSARGPVQHEEVHESESGETWLESLGWRSGVAFLGFVAGTAVVGALGLGERLSGVEPLAFVAVVFCGFLLGAGLLAMLLSWLAFQPNRGVTARHELVFAGTLGIVGAIGAAVVFVGWEPARTTGPAKSIAEVLERANEAYIEKNFGLNDGFDISPIVFVADDLDPLIRDFENMATSVEEEDHLVLQALVAYINEIKADQVAYLRRSWNFDQVTYETQAAAGDRLSWLHHQRLGGEAARAIRRFDKHLEHLPQRLEHCLRVAGVERNRAAALAGEYARSLELVAQRGVLVGELEILDASLRLRSHTANHPGVVGVGSADALTPDEHARYVELLDHLIELQVGHYGRYADLYDKIRLLGAATLIWPGRCVTTSSWTPRPRQCIVSWRGWSMRCTPGSTSFMRYLSCGLKTCADVTKLRSGAPTLWNRSKSLSFFSIKTIRCRSGLQANFKRPGFRNNRSMASSGSLRSEERSLPARKLTQKRTYA